MYIYSLENGDVTATKIVLMVLMSGIVQIKLEKDAQLLVMVNLCVIMVIVFHLEIDVMAKKIVLMVVMRTELCVLWLLAHLGNIDVITIIVYLTQMYVMVLIIAVIIQMRLRLHVCIFV